MRYHPDSTRQIMFTITTRAAAIGKPVSFPFTAEDVVSLFFVHKQLGRGTWFHLHDGRVFDSEGQAADTNISLYA